MPADSSNCITEADFEKLFSLTEERLWKSVKKRRDHAKYVTKIKNEWPGIRYRGSVPYNAELFFYAIIDAESQRTWLPYSGQQRVLATFEAEDAFYPTVVHHRVVRAHGPFKDFDEVSYCCCRYEQQLKRFVCVFISRPFSACPETTRYSRIMQRSLWTITAIDDKTCEYDMIFSFQLDKTRVSFLQTLALHHYESIHHENLLKVSYMYYHSKTAAPYCTDNMLETAVSMGQLFPEKFRFTPRFTEKEFLKLTERKLAHDSHFQYEVQTALSFLANQRSSRLSDSSSEHTDVGHVITMGHSPGDRPLPGSHKSEYRHRYEIVRVIGQGELGVVYLGIERTTESTTSNQPNSESSSPLISPRASLNRTAPARSHEGNNDHAGLDTEDIGLDLASPDPDADTNGPVLVAIKRVKVEDLDALNESLNETKVLYKLKHPNVITLRDFYCAEEDGESVFYVVTDFCEGGDLQRFLLNEYIGHKDMDLHVVVAWMIDIAKGIEYLHANNFVHHDLRPENILITADNELKIGDLGLAHHVQMFTSPMGNGTHFPAAAAASFPTNSFFHAQQPMVVADTQKMRFAAPEVQRQGIDGSSKASDVWSLGCILLQFLMLPEKFTFDTSRHLSAITRAPHSRSLSHPNHNNGKANPPISKEALFERQREYIKGRVAEYRSLSTAEATSKVESHVHSELTNLVQKCLALDPQQRPTASDVLNTLLKLQQQLVGYDDVGRYQIIEPTDQGAAPGQARSSSDLSSNAPIAGIKQKGFRDHIPMPLTQIRRSRDFESRNGEDLPPAQFVSSGAPAPKQQHQKVMALQSSSNANTSTPGSTGSVGSSQTQQSSQSHATSTANSSPFIHILVDRKPHSKISRKTFQQQFTSFEKMEAAMRQIIQRVMPRVNLDDIVFEVTYSSAATAYTGPQGDKPASTEAEECVIYEWNWDDVVQFIDVIHTLNLTILS